MNFNSNLFFICLFVKQYNQYFIPYYSQLSVLPDESTTAAQTADEIPR